MGWMEEADNLLDVDPFANSSYADDLGDGDGEEREAEVGRAERLIREAQAELELSFTKGPVMGNGLGAQLERGVSRLGMLG